MNLDKANLKLASAGVYLSYFNLKVFYIAGTLNVVPNALSRLPTRELQVPGGADGVNDELGDISTEGLVVYTASHAEMSPEFRTKWTDGYKPTSASARSTSTW
jgi:hypothetical protein